MKSYITDESLVSEFYRPFHAGKPCISQEDRLVVNYDTIKLPMPIIEHLIASKVVHPLTVTIFHYDYCQIIARFSRSQYTSHLYLKLICYYIGRDKTVLNNCGNNR